MFVVKALEDLEIEDKELQFIVENVLSKNYPKKTCAVGVFNCMDDSSNMTQFFSKVESKIVKLKDKDIFDIIAAAKKVHNDKMVERFGE